jgi:hypothetical protein
MLDIGISRLFPESKISWTTGDKGLLNFAADVGCQCDGAAATAAAARDTSRSTMFIIRAIKVLSEGRSV